MNTFRVVFKEDPARGQWWSETTDANGGELRNAKVGGAGNKANALRFSAEHIITEIEKFASADYAVDPVLGEAVEERMNWSHGNNPPAHLAALLETMKANTEANW